jgi:hypothetical protein
MLNGEDLFVGKTFYQQVVASYVDMADDDYLQVMA